MPMTGHATLGDESDNSSVEELVRSVRFLCKMQPAALQAFTATASALRAALPRATLSATALSIAKQMGRDPDEMSVWLGAQAAAKSDAALFDEMPRERQLMCRQLGGGADPVARARALGWLGTTPAVPGGGRTALSMSDTIRQHIDGLTRRNPDGSGSIAL